LSSTACLWALVLVGAPGQVTRDAAWARSLPDGTEVYLPAGHYVGPWSFEHRVQLRADPGATLSPGASPDARRTTLTLHAGGKVEGLTVQATPKGYAVRIDHSPQVVLSGLHLGGVGEAGLYLAASDVKVSDCDFEGNDYGVLTEGPSTLEVVGSRFKGNRRTGLALVGTSAVIERNEFEGPFLEAAVLGVRGDSLKLRGNQVAAAGSIGLKFLSSKVALDGDRVRGARSDKDGLEGNGLYAYRSTVEGANVQIDDTRGTAVSVVGGRVALRNCTIAHSSEAAAYVSSGGALLLAGCTLSDTPVGVFVEPDATADTRSTRFERVEHHIEKGK
jgi:nitrous oxidase accessory protein NosD